MILDIRVYPVLQAPNAVDLIAGASLIEVFRKFVLNDPEVAARAWEAIRENLEYERVFIEGSCFPHGVSEWPVGWGHGELERYANVSERDDVILRIPEAVKPAHYALAMRFHALMELLRRGEIQAIGIPAFANLPTVLPRSLWSHRNFHFNAMAGDLYELNRDAVDPPRDSLIKRWTGLMIERAGPKQAIQEANSDPRERQTKAIEQAITTGAAYQACLRWLISVIEKSLMKRTHSREALWRIAHRKWPKNLSRRSFDDARREAIRATDAAAWRFPGAPRKSRKSNRRTR
jgi:hypothetical protein